MIAIDIIDETETLKAEQLQTVQRLLESAADSEGIEGNAEVSLTFVNDDRIQALNQSYRNTDRPTDVLSFALQEGEAEPVAVGTADGLPRVLGDIVVSVPTAKDQAAAYNHSFLRELGFLTMHGFLHLLGYDHMTSEDERSMFSRQKDLLQSYGLER